MRISDWSSDVCSSDLLGTLVVGSDLGTDIVHSVVRFARVVRDHLEQVQVQFALADDTHNRQPDPFFPYCIQVLRSRAGHSAAHVGMVADVGGEEWQLDVTADGRAHGDLGGMRATGPEGA